mmetsp:Transcript_12753/g.27812  ORF Transcript_12753/g.27812 Transcript_12753/m.27812 type:complete len:225 (-) Transcript_12753:280-954(-)
MEAPSNAAKASSQGKLNLHVSWIRALHPARSAVKIFRIYVGIENRQKSVLACLLHHAHALRYVRKRREETRTSGARGRGDSRKRVGHKRVRCILSAKVTVSVFDVVVYASVHLPCDFAPSDAVSCLIQNKVIFLQCKRPLRRFELQRVLVVRTKMRPAAPLEMNLESLPPVRAVLGNKRFQQRVLLLRPSIPRPGAPFHSCATLRVHEERDFHAPVARVRTVRR